MLDGQNRPRSPPEPSERGDSTRPGTADRPASSVPAPLEIDLGIDPVAYRYESWSGMADVWIESIRSTVETMPDPDYEQVRNVTPLVPLSEVEALLERMVVSGEAVVPHEHTDATRDTPSP